MTLRRPLLATLAAFALAAPAAADTGNFVVRLGNDTTAVERYTRTDTRVEVDQVGRSPRVMRRHFVYTFGKGGALRQLSVVVTTPGAATPMQTIEVDATGDSVRTEVRNSAGPSQRFSAALPAGTLIVSGTSPWLGYESRTMMMTHDKRDSYEGRMYFLGQHDPPYWLRMRRVGGDSIEVSNQHLDVFRARVDRTGRILGVRPISGTAKFSLERVASLDLDGLMASFAAREKAAGAMGMLSPRDSVVTTAGGASLRIDYCRPGKRGRVIFGEVVPWGEVWRTGANAATLLKTDKALDFGGVVVPAGSYSLWTIPSPEGWKLLVNGQTGQWGTDHDPKRDLYTIPMKVSTLPEAAERFTIGVEPAADGGALNLDWDTTRASATFVVKP